MINRPNPIGLSSDTGFNMKPGSSGEVLRPAEPKAGEPCQECMDPKPAKDEVIKVRISLFFDGTLNNRANSSNRQSEYAEEGTSYLNSVSNIGILEDCKLAENGPGADHHETIYIEGIGTQTGDKDTLFGKSMGTGDAGIFAKVDRGIKEAVGNIIVAAGSKKIVWVHLDTFGFSRGAAAARKCVHQAITKGSIKQQLSAAGKPPGSVECKFVGLYDTVASYGAVHYNDTSDLNMDCLNEAAKVVQLAAADEHRANFRLTNIKSAGGKGEEHFLPGVHSDVGGGYNDGADEDVLLLNIPLVDPHAGTLHENVKLYDREVKWFTTSGWYLPSQLTCSKGINGTIRGTRKGISNAYSSIPLKIMADFAGKYGVKIGNDLDDYHPIPSSDPELTQAYAEISKKVKARSDASSAVWFKDDPSGDPTWLKHLRNKYFHFSATSSFGMGPERKNGYRRRVIQDG